MKILLANKEKASPQIAHLQFARAYAQTPNYKRAILDKHKIMLYHEDSKNKIRVLTNFIMRI